MKNKILQSETHILVISPYFYPHIGGSQRYIEELYAHIIQAHPTVQVTVLTYNTDTTVKTEQYRGMTIFRIPTIQILPGQFAIPNPISLLNALVHLATKNITVVHTHIRYFDATWWAWLYAKIIGSISIFTEHVANHPVHKSKLVETVGKIVDKTIAVWSINRYDIVTTTNTPAKLFLENLGVKKPITVSYGGIDTTFFHPNDLMEQRIIPVVNRIIDNNTTVITFAGRVIWSKGISYLLSAIRTFDKQQHVLFIIAGTGDLLPWVKEQVIKYSLQDIVEITGPLQSGNIKALYQISDIVVHPSHHNEGFPNTILEAGASGCFVIATNNAGTGEIITNKKTGLFIQQKSVKSLSSALTWAITHEEERRQMGRALQASICNKFDWNIIAESFSTLLHATICTGNAHVIPMLI